MRFVVVSLLTILSVAQQEIHGHLLPVTSSAALLDNETTTGTSDPAVNTDATYRGKSRRATEDDIFGSITRNDSTNTEHLLEANPVIRRDENNRNSPFSDLVTHNPNIVDKHAIPTWRSFNRPFVWPGTNTTLTSSTTTVLTPFPTLRHGPCEKTYVVQDGDTCVKLCVYLGLSLEELIMFNPGMYVERNGHCPLRVGQNLCVARGNRNGTTDSSPSSNHTMPSTSMSVFPTPAPTSIGTTTTEVYLPSSSSESTTQPDEISILVSGTAMQIFPIPSTGPPYPVSLPSTTLCDKTHAPGPLPNGTKSVPTSSTFSSGNATSPSSGPTSVTSSPTGLHVIPVETMSSNGYGLAQSKPTQVVTTAIDTIPLAKTTSMDVFLGVALGQKKKCVKKGVKNKGLIWGWNPMTFHVSTVRPSDEERN
ncbi:hypothetical protein GGS21DRAFT_546256 [Xylaria nigripes]|nr:hypothetical protein GGS21DRAFT_546256 [Xylaria nigripes]